MDVYSPVKHFELNCPPAVEANQEFCCPVSVYQGSNMCLEAKFTGGSNVSTPLDGKKISPTVALLQFYSKQAVRKRLPANSWHHGFMTFDLVIGLWQLLLDDSLHCWHCTLEKGSSASVICSLPWRCVKSFDKLTGKNRCSQEKILQSMFWID